MAGVIRSVAPPSTSPLRSRSPCYLALQRRTLAPYLRGMKREGRKVPRNRPTNWGFKLANQLMQEDAGDRRGRADRPRRLLPGGG
jgi:hypothetical protein